MKKLTISILTVAAVFAGLGIIADKAGARMKSDERALELIRQARIAIGGDQSIGAVRSLTISGRTTTTFKFGNGERTEQGETELALQLPDKFSKTVKIGRHEGGEANEQIVNRQNDVFVIRKGQGGEKVVIDGKEDPTVAKIIAGRGDGEFTTEDGKKIVVRRVEGAPEGAPMGDKIIIRKDGNGTPEANIEKIVVAHDMKAGHEGMRQNELLRVALSLLLTAPDGMDVSYTFGGETDVDGTPCNLVNAEFAGSTIKLYLSKASSLPVMVGYTGHELPMMFKMTRTPEGADKAKDIVVFNRKVEGPAPSLVDYQVRFSDYRGVGGVQLPFKWTTSTGGRTTEVLDVTSYELNPANIADKFKEQKVFVRTKAPDSK